MTKWRLALAVLGLFLALPLHAFDWEEVSSDGRDYVTLRSFCAFYGFAYSAPGGNDRFTSRNAAHSVSFKVSSSDAYIDGIHYVLSFPVENGAQDWLVSKMDVIKLFEPVLRPDEVSGRHTIRGVVIDAGHGGTDNGATSRLGNEKTYTLDTAFRLAQILNGAGLRTAFTRRNDVFVDLYERAHIASLYPDYCFVSIHYNSASAEAHGLETYCLSPRGAASTSSRYLTRGDIQKLPGNDYDPENILLASMVHSEIIRLNPGDASADRGVKRARFVVIKMNVLPAILVEGGFVSNHMEAARVNRPDYRQALARAIARGVIRFINLMGDRHMALPSEPPLGTFGGGTPPRALPVALPAPAGLAHDPANGKKAGASSASTHKKSTTKNTTVNAGQPSSATPSGPLAPSPEPLARAGKGTKGGGEALNLTEPAAPAVSPDSARSSDEPDEPPTVNSTPPTPAHHAGSTNAAPAHEP